MTQMDLFQTATSSQQDTPASHLVLPGSAEAQKMTDISGHTYFPLFKEKDPLGAFSRMFMGMSLWASTRCYLTWKGKATPQGRSLFQLVPLTHLTDETEFGSSEEMWATPNTMDHLPQRSKEALKKQATTSRKGRARPANLREQVNPETVQAWKEAQEPTMWPTVTARDYKGGRTPEALAKAGRNETNSLPDAVNAQMGKTGSLNPQWVEWLMGYPEGWTDLKD
jgi:hypothetical protein